MNITIDSSHDPCYSESIQVNVNAQNIGTTISNGVLWLQRDNIIEEFEYVDEPDTLIETDSSIRHLISTLIQQTIKFLLTYQMKLFIKSV